MTDVNTFSGYVGVEHDEAKQLVRDRSYGYRWYEAVPRMMQKTQADHRCEET